jgi:hypothetical protein
MNLWAVSCNIYIKPITADLVSKRALQLLKAKA